jgi:hypothetical protein
MLDPELLPCRPDDVAGVHRLAASLLTEVNRLGAIVDELERLRQMRVESRLNREAAALAEGRVLGKPGRPRKIDGAQTPPG